MVWKFDLPEYENIAHSGGFRCKNSGRLRTQRLFFFGGGDKNFGGDVFSVKHTHVKPALVTDAHLARALLSKIFIVVSTVWS